ncbi:MAG: YihA family ribosome biogenesis GTP-binding protein [Bacteroidales bacterium]|nr:YihA family ribosome biogenesis GTP-binding protein [Bacteroidales bacterium]
MLTEIKKIEFVKSSPDLRSCPDSDLPEYAFVGRSNVGKSSLINYITERKSLAKTSSTPGKTRLINHFIIDNSWFLVDLPGYGYAKVSKKDREKFMKIIHDYLLKRENMICLFILIDSRHSPQKADLDFIRWSGQKEIPFVLVFTKTDKLKPGELDVNVAEYRKQLLTEWEELPPVFLTSTVKKTGRNEILSFIIKTNLSLK